jgi:Fe-S oxidoreductase
VCPVGIEIVPIINLLRRGMVETGEIENSLKAALTAIQNTGNSFGESARKRARWSRELGFEILDARETEVEFLWFVGDFASLDPRNQINTRALAHFAVFPTWHANFSIKTVSRLLEGNVHRVLEVSATIDLRATAATASPCATKDLAKNITKRIAKACATCSACSVGVNASMPVTIVGRTLAVIRQDLISLFGLLEFFFGFFAIRVAIRMIFHRQFAISFFQLVI